MSLCHRKERPALPPKPAFLSKTLGNVKHGKAKYTNRAIALYDFEYCSDTDSLLQDTDNDSGLAKFHELSFIIGEVLNLECTPIESEFPAWGIATRSMASQSERGLVPLEYLQLIDESSPSESLMAPRIAADILSWKIDPTNAPSTGVAPTQNMDVAEEQSFEVTFDSRPGANHSNLLGGREINRFSTFVRAGVEDYLIGAPPRTQFDHLQRIRERSDSEAGHGLKYYIEDGPAWHETMQHYEIRVDSFRVVRAESHDSHATYSIRTVYGQEAEEINICVERRFRDIESLHSRLIRKFPLIVMPNIPTKTITPCLEVKFLGLRRKNIEQYLRRIARHPALRCSDPVTSFLSDEYYHGSDLSEEIETTDCCFFDLVIHPEWNHDDGDRATVEDFSRRLEGTLNDMTALLSSLEQINVAVSQHVRAITQLAGTLAEASINKGSLLHDQTAAADTLLLAASKNLALGQQYRVAYSSRSTTSFALLDDWRHLAAGWTNLTKVHSVTTQKLALLRSQPSDTSAVVEGRCDTILNVILAEMDILRRQCIEDMLHLSQELLASQSSLHEDCRLVLGQQAPLPLSMSCKRQMIKAIDDAENDLDTPARCDPSYLSRFLQLVFPWT